MNQADEVYGVTEHGVGDGEGERRSARHPPAGAQVGQLDPQHLHDHLVVEGQVEVMLVGELQVRTGQVKGCPSCPPTPAQLLSAVALILVLCLQRRGSILAVIRPLWGSCHNQANHPVACPGAGEGKGTWLELFTAPQLRI